MLILGLDFETTGREQTIHSVVEVGTVLWCTELRRPVRSTAHLVYDRNAVWEEGASEANGITQEQCALFGIESEKALAHLISCYSKIHAVCTYNGNIFDRPFYEAWCDRFGLSEFKDLGKTWIDAKVDLPFPKKKWHNLCLKHLAAEHNILHRHAHGALPDANITLEIFDMYDLRQVMESALSPTVTVQALVSYADREKARAEGYYWRPEQKQWIKSIKASRIENEVASAGFPVKIIPK